MACKLYNPDQIKRKTLVPILLFIFINGTFFSQNEPAIAKKHKYWALERDYVYDVTYEDSLGKVLSHETLTLQPTEKAWEIDSKQTLLTFLLSYTPSDSISLYLKSPNGLKRRWAHKFQEGVIENENRIWMHPLRQNQYALTEIAPFPEVKLPLQTGHLWESKLEIYQGFGTFQGDVKSKYVIELREARQYKFGTLACWKINATGEHNKLGKSGVVYYFNKDIGFTEMNYWFYNGYKISLKLIQFK